MTAQVLFFDCFFEKGPDLNVVEKRDDTDGLCADDNKQITMKWK